MLSIQEKKEISNIFVAQIFLELLAIIFDTFLFEHPVEIIKLRLAHYSEVVGSTDLIFGMQGAFMCLVETLEFQKTQRSEASFSFPAQY